MKKPQACQGEEPAWGEFRVDGREDSTRLKGISDSGAMPLQQVVQVDSRS